MRILILTQVFPPERHPTAIMVDQLATYLATEGHTVAVATGLPSHPTPTEFQDFPSRTYSRESRGGYSVLRAWHPRPRSRSFRTRAVGMASQALASTVAAFGFRHPDVVVVFGFPMMGPLLAALRAKLGRARVVSVIYDLYPDIAVESGLLPSRLAQNLAHAIADLGYKLSDRVVVLSEGFRRQLIDREVPGPKVDVVPVWLDPDEIRPTLNDGSWAVEHGLDPDRPIALYAGTLGVVSGAQVVISAADELRSESPVQFVIVGDGELKAELQREAVRRGLDNVAFISFQPRSELGRMQSSATISIVTLAKGRGRTSVPSKVVAYLAAGRPVVASVDSDSDTATCVRRGGGVAVAPGDGIALADAIRDLLGNPHALGVRAEIARQHFAEEYDSRQVLPRFATLISDSSRAGMLNARSVEFGHLED